MTDWQADLLLREPRTDSTAHRLAEAERLADRWQRSAEHWKARYHRERGYSWMWACVAAAATFLLWVVGK